MILVEAEKPHSWILSQWLVILNSWLQLKLEYLIFAIGLAWSYDVGTPLRYQAGRVA